MQSELKPCPLCQSDNVSQGATLEQSKQHGFVRCFDCGCSAPIAAWDTRASDAEITRLTSQLRAAEKREKALRKDVKRLEVEDVVAHCERCSAPLLINDDFIADDDCVHGCWAAMTDTPSRRERPCYAYRVGKPDAHAALKGPSHDA